MCVWSMRKEASLGNKAELLNGLQKCGIGKTGVRLCVFKCVCMCLCVSVCV